ncbi:MAG: TRAP transporter large permease [Bacteroidota bacterium]
MEVIEILILVLSFLTLLAAGVPIAYSIGLSSLLTLLVSMDSLTAFTTIAQRMGTGLDSFALLAIPFFILAGQLMNQGGIAQRLINFAKALIGWLPGGLAHVNIIANMMFGAISGSAVAAASAIGGVMHERMVKEGYDEEVSAAVNISSATTGLIIPPSNVLIVYSLASGGASIGALFVAGYIPGFLVGLTLMGVAAWFAIKRKYPTDKLSKLSDTFKSFVDALPSLLLLIIVIGGIIAGIFTATEASAVAVLYAMVLAFVYKEIRWKDMPDILLSSVKTTSIVMILVATSMAMSWVMAFENIPQNVSELLLSISDSKIVVLMIINLLLLFVGVFMDMTPAVLIFTPIFLPVVTKLGLDPVHFGIIMVLNLCIGLCTPPVGSVLFVGSAVSKVSISKVIRPLLPMFIAMIIALILVTYIPALSLWLPAVFGMM